MASKKGIDSASLWGPVARTGIGRPAGHSRDEITAAAIAIADADGLAAVSIRRVATAIGAGAMSLYSYVPDKETLIELMIDHVAGEQELTPPTGQPLADLRDFARSLRVVIRRHPWLSTAFATRQTLGPNALAGMDHILAILADTDLDTPAKLELLAVLTGLVVTYVQYEVGQLEVTRRTGRSAAEFAAGEVAYLVGVAKSGRYPHLAQALAQPAQAADPDLLFDRTVARVVSGLLSA